MTVVMSSNAHWLRTSFALSTFTEVSLVVCRVKSLSINLHFLSESMVRYIDTIYFQILISAPPLTWRFSDCFPGLISTISAHRCQEGGICLYCNCYRNPWHSASPFNSLSAQTLVFLECRGRLELVWEERTSPEPTTLLSLCLSSASLSISPILASPVKNWVGESSSSRSSCNSDLWVPPGSRRQLLWQHMLPWREVQAPNSSQPWRRSPHKEMLARRSCWIWGDYTKCASSRSPVSSEVGLRAKGTSSCHICIISAPLHITEESGLQEPLQAGWFKGFLDGNIHNSGVGYRKFSKGIRYSGVLKTLSLVFWKQQVGRSTIRTGNRKDSVARIIGFNLM